MQLYFNAKLLATDEVALKKVAGLLTELEDKGYLKEGRIVFDSNQENDVKEIFDRYLLIDNTSKGENL